MSNYSYLNDNDIVACPNMASSCKNNNNNEFICANDQVT